MVAGLAGALRPEREGTPTSVKANYTIPASDTPNWGTASTVKTSPYAEDGTLPFIQTTLDLPGVLLRARPITKPYSACSGCTTDSMRRLPPNTTGCGIARAMPFSLSAGIAGLTIPCGVSRLR